MSECKECKYFNPIYLECEYPDVPLSESELCLPDDESCDYFEMNRSEQDERKEK